MEASFISDTTFNAPSFKSNIKMIRVPEGVTTLANNALGGTTSTNNIIAIVLPSTLQSIGNNGLRNNTELVSIACYATTPPTIGTNALGGISKIKQIFVPYESIGLYSSASG